MSPDFLGLPRQRSRVPSRPLPPIPSSEMPTSTSPPHSTLDATKSTTFPSSSPSGIPLELAPAPTEGIWYRKMSLWPPAEFKDPFAPVAPSFPLKKHTASSSASDSTCASKSRRSCESEHECVPSVLDTATTKTLVHEGVNVIDITNEINPSGLGLITGPPVARSKPHYVLRRTQTQGIPIVNISTGRAPEAHLNSKNNSNSGNARIIPRKPPRRNASDPKLWTHKTRLESRPLATTSQNAMPVLSPSRTPLSPDRIIHPHVYNGAITESGVRTATTNGLPHQVEDKAEKPELSLSQTVEHGQQVLVQQLGDNPRKLAEGGGIIPVAATLGTTNSALADKYTNSTLLAMRVHPQSGPAVLPYSRRKPSPSVTSLSSTDMTIRRIPVTKPFPSSPSEVTSQSGFKLPVEVSSSPSSQLAHDTARPRTAPATISLSPTIPMITLPNNGISPGSLPRNFPPSFSSQAIDPAWHRLIRLSTRSIVATTPSSSTSASMSPESIYSDLPSWPSTSATSHYLYQQTEELPSGAKSSPLAAPPSPSFPSPEARISLRASRSSAALDHYPSPRTRIASYAPQLSTPPDEIKLGGAWEEPLDPWGFIAESHHAQEALRARVLSLALDGPSPNQKATNGQKEEFREYEDLSTADIFKASLLDVLDVEGNPVRFGRLFEDQLTIVVFIRHFWCPLCQDYMQSITEGAPKEVLDRSGVKLVIIGNGSPAMAKAYRNDVFQCPYPIYVDPTRAVYHALGMTRRTTDSGPESQKGSYVRHGALSGMGMVLKNALKMPIGKAGNIKQLGGEFLLGPGIRADYAHRMPTTRSHTSVKRLLQLANIDMSPIPTKLRLFLDVDAEDQWMRSRQKEWGSMLRWKELRRWGMDPDYDFGDLELDGDSGMCGLAGSCQANLPRIGGWPPHDLTVSSGDESRTFESSA